MSGIDIASIMAILFTGGFFVGLMGFLGGRKSPNDGLFDFERDYAGALKKSVYQGEKPPEEAVFVGTSSNRKNVFIRSDAKHVFVCGTTGSGKTVAMSNFLAGGAKYDYPMLIIDGKGDTDAGSLLEMTRRLCPARKLYVINLNEPAASDKYNPFKNANTDVIKDMLINMTNWSEEHAVPGRGARLQR